MENCLNMDRLSHVQCVLCVVYPLCLTHHQISVINLTCEEKKNWKWSTWRLRIAEQWTDTTYRKGRQIIIIKKSREREGVKKARKRARKSTRHIRNAAKFSLFDISTRGKSDFFLRHFFVNEPNGAYTILIHIILVLFFSLSLHRSLLA